jgi:hypothetical protein
LALRLLGLDWISSDDGLITRRLIIFIRGVVAQIHTGKLGGQTQMTASRLKKDLTILSSRL